jgi:hypothetical protein
MRYLFFLLLFSSKLSGQKLVQFNDYIYILPTAATVSSNALGGKQFQSALTTDTLLRIYDNGVAVWKANLQAANISDTLSTTGITGLCRITVPNSIGTNQIIQIRDIAIIIPNTYTLEYQPFWQLPITVRRNSDSQIMCIVYENGFIDWHITPQWAWTGRVGTTRIKRITLP